MPVADDEMEFDRFLAEALAPPRRPPDQRFAERVRRQIMLDEMLRAKRAKDVERLGVELLSLVALGCGVLALGRAPEIAESVRELPHVALGAMLMLFGLWVTLVAGPSKSARGPKF